MKLFNAYFTILNQPEGLNGINEMIELAGKRCYASTHNIQYAYKEKIPNVSGTNDFYIYPEDSDNPTETIKYFEQRYNDGDRSIIRTSTTAEAFVERMMNSNHGAMLEHGTVYLTIPLKDCNFQKLNNRYSDNKYSVVKDCQFVTTNLRVLFENDWLNDLQYLTEPCDLHEKRICVFFGCDRVTGESFLRHRVFSFARESTRYCNFSKDKFGSEISITIPSYINNDEVELHLKEASLVENPLRHYCGLISDEWDDVPYTSMSAIDYWLFANLAAEYSYMKLTQLGWSAEKARCVLPFDLSSPLVMTGFVKDWIHYFDLRANDVTGKAHPCAKALAQPLMEEFLNLKLI